MIDLEAGGVLLRRHGSGSEASAAAYLGVLGRPAIAGRVGEVRANVRQNDVDLVRYRGGENSEEVAGCAPGGPFMHLCGELGRGIHGYQQVEEPFLGANFGNVDVKVAEQLVSELASGGCVTLDLRQLQNAVPLETAVL